MLRWKFDKTRIGITINEHIRESEEVYQFGMNEEKT